MKIGKRIEGWFRTARLAPKVLWRYRTLSPSWVTLPHAPVMINIDPIDSRARKKLIYEPIRNRYPVNRQFWVDFCRTVNPDVAIDVGANYGECVFSVIYPADCVALAVEANPKLAGHLRMTREQHPACDQIEVVEAIAGDRVQESTHFYINENWSGGSSAVASVVGDDPAVREIKQRSTSIDVELSRLGVKASRIVFKIDVEGYEPNVLMGMLKSVSLASLAIGFVEIDRQFLEQAGWGLERYQEEVLDHFDLYAPIGRDPKALSHISDLRGHFEDRHERGLKSHFDLLLVKGELDTCHIPEGWVISQLEPV